MAASERANERTNGLHARYDVTAAGRASETTRHETNGDTWTVINVCLCATGNAVTWFTRVKNTVSSGLVECLAGDVLMHFPQSSTCTVRTRLL